MLLGTGSLAMQSFCIFCYPNRLPRMLICSWLPRTQLCKEPNAPTPTRGAAPILTHQEHVPRMLACCVPPDIEHPSLSCLLQAAVHSRTKHWPWGGPASWGEVAGDVGPHWHFLQGFGAMGTDGKDPLCAPVLNKSKSNSTGQSHSLSVCGLQQAGMCTRASLLSLRAPRQVQVCYIFHLLLICCIKPFGGLKKNAGFCVCF